MKIKFLAFLFLLAAFQAGAKEIVTDLNGFRIGQFRDAPTNEFGKPALSDKYEDGFEYELFLLKPDTSLYMSFEYAAGYTDVIWSIQVSGTDASADISFKNLRLGMDKKEVEKILGKPSSRENIGEYGQQWNYDNTNYSVEINTKGKLSSIKIRDTYSADVPDASKIPSFANVVKTLSSGKNEEIASILSPGIEIYYQYQTFFFSRSWKDELKTDTSNVFRLIKSISRGLDKVNTSDSAAYEENVRLKEGQNPMHVIKIKKGHLIKEIVMQYANGKYVIWEIRT